MEIVLVIVAVWAVTGALSFAMAFGWLQHEDEAVAEFYYKRDRTISIAIGLGGPVSLLICLATGAYKHGLKWK